MCKKNYKIDLKNVIKFHTLCFDYTLTTTGNAVVINGIKL